MKDIIRAKQGTYTWFATFVTGRGLGTTNVAKLTNPMFLPSSGLGRSCCPIGRLPSPLENCKVLTAFTAQGGN